nr:hypothetical protein [Massilia glaciei]
MLGLGQRQLELEHAAGNAGVARVARRLQREGVARQRVLLLRGAVVAHRHHAVGQRRAPDRHVARGPFVARVGLGHALAQRQRAPDAGDALLVPALLDQDVADLALGDAQLAAPARVVRGLLEFLLGQREREHGARVRRPEIARHAAQVGELAEHRHIHLDRLDPGRMAAHEVLEVGAQGGELRQRLGQLARVRLAAGVQDGRAVAAPRQRLERVGGLAAAPRDLARGRRGRVVMVLGLGHIALRPGQVAEALVHLAQAGHVLERAAGAPRHRQAQRERLAVMLLRLLRAAEVGADLVAAHVADALVGAGDVALELWLEPGVGGQLLEVQQGRGDQFLARRRRPLLERVVDLEQHGARQLVGLVEAFLGHGARGVGLARLPQGDPGRGEHGRHRRRRHAQRIALHDLAHPVAPRRRDRVHRLVVEVALEVAVERVGRGVAVLGRARDRLEQDVVEVAAQLARQPPPGRERLVRGQRGRPALGRPGAARPPPVAVTASEGRVGASACCRRNISSAEPVLSAYGKRPVSSAYRITPSE